MSAPTRRRRPRTAIDPSRQTAYDALRLVEENDAYLNLALPALLTERGLRGRDAAFATELANGTARLQGSYDAVIDRLVKGGHDGLQSKVRTALRLGTHQLLSLRVPAHAAVATTVELVRADVGERPVRLVNAVLRTIATKPMAEWLGEVAPARDLDETGWLAVTYSHPRWIVDAFRDALAEAAAGGEPPAQPRAERDPELPADPSAPPHTQLEQLLRADNAPPAVTLVARPTLSSREELLAAGARPGRWSAYAAVLDGGDPGELSMVRAGRAGVQDEGSQLAALALTRPELQATDMRWLDLCAGPGGKAALLAGLAREKGVLLMSAERLEHRSRLVRAALRGYGGQPRVVTADARVGPWRSGTFDRAIVDVPCTGLGALRRRPEARWRRSPADVDDLVLLQRALLHSALDAVRPGGVVLYVTCSPHLAETRDVVNLVLLGRGDVRREDARALLPEVPDTGPGPYVQLWPHLHGTDAIFLALLRREAM